MNQLIEELLTKDIKTIDNIGFYIKQIIKNIKLIQNEQINESLFKKSNKACELLIDVSNLLTDMIFEMIENIDYKHIEIPRDLTTSPMSMQNANIIDKTNVSITPNEDGFNKFLNSLKIKN